jgi:hypothetical protein
VERIEAAEAGADHERIQARLTHRGLSILDESWPPGRSSLA